MPRITKAEVAKIKQQAFCDGIREGERRVLDLRTQMQKTNIHLLKLLNLVDVKYPVAGVTISFAFAQRLIKVLRHRGAWNVRRREAKELENLVDHANCELNQAMADWENEIGDVLNRG